MFIDWTAPPTASPATPEVPTGAPAPQLPGPALTLPWDFAASFPQPTDEAVDAGVLDETDLAPANLMRLHEEYFRDALALLAAIDHVQEATRRGIDPRTGKPARTHAAREKCRRALEHEPARLERSFVMLAGTYADAFGDEAADAFAKAVRARYAGIKIVADPSTIPPPRRPAASATLPRPKPLEAAVERGHFGEDEQGPMCPSGEEVKEITERLAERLIDLMNGLREVQAMLRAPVCSDRARLYREKDLLSGQIGNALAMYAEDFGQEAASQLRAYAAHEAGTAGLGAVTPMRLSLLPVTRFCAKVAR
jgi:hypothetical protein